MSEVTKQFRLTTLNNETQQLINEITLLQDQVTTNQNPEINLRLGIARLELEINGYKIELENAIEHNEKQQLRNQIQTKEILLHDFLNIQPQSLQQQTNQLRQVQQPAGVANPALVTAATAGCRVILDTFARNFQKNHCLPKQKACTYNLKNTSTTDILTHSEVCVGLTKELTEAKILWKETPQPFYPTDVSELFESLSDALHRNMFQGPGNVMWVYDGLEPIEKKWMLRYLTNKQYDVRIIAQNGLDREPTQNELYTPPKNSKKRKVYEEVKDPEVEVAKKKKKKKNKKKKEK